MNQNLFRPTEQQRDLFSCDGAAFITACPGAGKTRVMVERARRLFRNLPLWRGVAFLSFSQAAVFELDTRLRQEGILPSPVFPNFIGTFDSFLWQFLIAPFGVAGTDVRPRLVADINELLVRPFNDAHPLPLSCFDTSTNSLIPDAAKLRKFDVSKKSLRQVQAYETSARNLRYTMRMHGHLGFDEARHEALQRLGEPTLSVRIASALSKRFHEVIVDEAQDCNPEDLEIVSWLRKTGVAVKVVCDPHQSIFEFRGGITDHLFSFAYTFESHERKELTGNFRSTPNICKAITQLRPMGSRGTPDEALGPLKHEVTPVYVLSYGGRGVSRSIGIGFSQLLHQLDIDTSISPMLAATKGSAAAAAGQPRPSGRRYRAVRLAEAVTDFHFSSGFHDVKTALRRVHELLLDLEGHLTDKSYQQYLTDNDIEPVSWRPMVIRILQELRFNLEQFPNAKAWHTAAKDVLSRHLTISGGQSISQLLKWNSSIERALASVASDGAMPRTIHSVKGKEFPAVCVVTTASTLKGILEFLECGNPSNKAEEARKLYVAASRAQRLLVVAAPKSQADRLACHLRGRGANVMVATV